MKVAHCTGGGFQFTAVVGHIATSCRYTASIIMSLQHHHQKHNEHHIQQELGDVSQQLR